MKFTSLFTSLVLVLPTVLGASVQESGPVARAEAADAVPALADGDASDFFTSYVPLNLTELDLEVRAAAEFSQLERRNPAAIVLGAIAKLIGGILGQVSADNAGRGEFTKRTVSEGRAQYPHFNWAICHTHHTTHFDGAKGQDWGHYHREFDIKIGGTIGYEIYWFGSGTFQRHGDGGFLNWAYIGNVAETSDGGKRVVFRRP